MIKIHCLLITVFVFTKIPFFFFSTFIFFYLWSNFDFSVNMINFQNKRDKNLFCLRVSFRSEQVVSWYIRINFLHRINRARLACHSIAYWSEVMFLWTSIPKHCHRSKSMSRLPTITITTNADDGEQCSRSARVCSRSYTYKTDGEMWTSKSRSNNSSSHSECHWNMCVLRV